MSNKRKSSRLAAKILKFPKFHILENISKMAKLPRSLKFLILKKLNVIPKIDSQSHSTYFWETIFKKFWKIPGTKRTFPAIIFPVI